MIVSKILYLLQSVSHKDKRIKIAKQMSGKKILGFAFKFN